MSKNNLYYYLQQKAQEILLKKTSDDKTMLEMIIGQIPEVYNFYKKAIDRCLLSEKIEAYKTIAELTNSLAEYNRSIGFQNLIKVDPKAIQLIIQNNTQINNKSSDNENEENEFLQAMQEAKKMFPSD